MRVLIYEPYHTGHRLAYVKRMIPAIQELASELIVVLSRIASETTEFRTHLADLDKSVLFDFSVPPARVGLNGALDRSKGFANALGQWRPGHVYVPYADGLAQVWGVRQLLGDRFLDGARAEGLLMRGTFAYPTSTFCSRLKAEAGLAAARAAPWERVHFTDPLIYAEVERRGGLLAARSRIIPDPVDPTPALDRFTARRSLGIPEDGRYIGCAGGLAEWKGIDLLIDAFIAARLGPADRLLLAGPRSEAIREQLQRQDIRRLIEAQRIVSMDGYLSNAEFAQAIASLDVVCTPYPRHIGSASIVMLAAAAGKPVLASNWGWMGYIVPQFGLGKCIDVTNPQGFAAAIPDALEHAPEFRLGDAAQRFVEFHTVENFQRHWTELLRTRLGLPPKPLRTWQWVQGGESE